MEYVAVAKPDPDDGGWVLTVPGASGVITQADRVEDMRGRAEEALEAWLRVELEDGGVPPRPGAAPTRAPRGGHLVSLRMPAALVVALQIRWLRTDAGWSQADLATRVGVSQRQIAKWESGRENPTVDAIERVAAALGVRLDVRLVA